MDPLSDIVSLLHPHDCVAAGLDAGGDWSVQFQRHAGLKCNAVLKGSCWMSVEGVSDPFLLKAGDCVILPKGLPFLIASRPAVSGVDSEMIYAPVAHGGTAVYGSGGDFFMTGSRFLLSGPASAILLGALPAVIRVRPGPHQETVRWSINRIVEELRSERPGAALSIAHLSHFLLLQALRCHLEDTPAGTSGWLAAIADAQLVRSVTAMHGAPARAWTVSDLASCSGLSRTSFAVRFRNVVGQTPIEYLTQLRMLIAGDRLRRTSFPIARIAEEIGYSSESAFAVAFKRETGHSPRRYSRNIAHSGLTQPADDPSSQGA